MIRIFHVIGFMVLFFIILNQIIAQSDKNSSYYDKTGQLNYLPFVIKKT